MTLEIGIISDMTQAEQRQIVGLENHHSDQVLLSIFSRKPHKACPAPC